MIAQRQFWKYDRLETALLLFTLFLNLWFFFAVMWRCETGCLEMFLAYYEVFGGTASEKKTYRDFLLEVLSAHEQSLRWTLDKERGGEVGNVWHEVPSSIRSVSSTEEASIFPSQQSLSSTECASLTFLKEEVLEEDPQVHRLCSTLPEVDPCRDLSVRKTLPPLLPESEQLMCEEGPRGETFSENFMWN